jgi:hypothetical protein
MRVSAILAVLLLSTATAQAQYSTKHVASGKPVRLHFSYSLNPDCTRTGEISMRVTQAPQHGQVHATRAREFPNYAATNVRSACNRRRVEGMLASYVSARGFTGTDYLSIEAIYPKGLLKQLSYTIDVR